MKAIRSLGANSMEVEFTEPVVSAAPSNFAVRYWGYLQGGSANNESYGAGAQVGGNGFNAPSDFAFEVSGDAVARMTISG